MVRSPLLHLVQSLFDSFQSGFDVAEFGIDMHGKGEEPPPEFVIPVGRGHSLPPPNRHRVA
jgi:hypothetical protein